MIDILKNARDTRDKQLKVEREAAGLEKSLKEKSTKELLDELANIEVDYKKDLIILEIERQKRLDRKDNAKESTVQLANKFGLDNLDDS